MRIISKFRDYYDAGQVYGQDPDLVYVRRAEKVPLVDPHLSVVERLGKKLPRRRDFRLTLEPNLIGFCGKVYLGYEANATIHAPMGSFSLHTWLHSPEDFQKFFSGKARKALAPNFYEKPRRKRWGTPYLRFKNVKEAYANFPSEALTELFHSLNSPVWRVQFSRASSMLNKLGQNPEVEINGSLRDTEFYRVVDTYTAYQELSMYVGGVLRRAEPICAEISDLSMRDKKGFDEWSFKTRPKEGK